jgi:hypothetical protein
VSICSAITAALTMSKRALHPMFLTPSINDKPMGFAPIFPSAAKRILIQGDSNEK